MQNKTVLGTEFLLGLTSERRWYTEDELLDAIMFRISPEEAEQIYTTATLNSRRSTARRAGRPLPTIDDVRASIAMPLRVARGQRRAAMQRLLRMVERGYWEREQTTAGRQYRRIVWDGDKPIPRGVFATRRRSQLPGPE